MESSGSRSGPLMRGTSSSSLKRSSDSDGPDDIPSLLPPPKRSKVTAEVSLSSLPSRAVERIISMCGLKELSSLGRTCRKLNHACLAFFLSSASTRTIFPFLSPADAETLMDPLPGQIVHITSQPYSLNTTSVKEKFVELGLALKQLTILLPTMERMEHLGSILSRLELLMVQDSSQTSNRIIFSWVGAALTTFVLGWTKRDCVLACRFLVDKMKEEGLNTLLQYDYTLGENKGLEILYRLYWIIVFHREVEGPQQQLWLDTLLSEVAGANNRLAARVLLIMSTPAREDVSKESYGILWTDHVEAIPANWPVAKARYSNMVNLLRLVRSGSFSWRFNHILWHMFTMPANWLPENVGSILLMMGEETTANYLLHLCSIRGEGYLKFISIAIIGLAVMTVR